MNDHNQGREVLHIKKYPNRRYYDTSRSCHVTLHDVHDLVVAGRDVCITDSRTGEDITNLVLTQILLEKDQPKLDIFPSSIFHMMIRSDRQVLRAYVERFFAPMLGVMASSRKQFEQFIRTASGGAFMTPLDWTSRMMEFFGQSKVEPGSPTPVADPEWDSTADGDDGMAPGTESARTNPPAEHESIDELRAEAAELIRRIERISPPAAENSANSD